MKILKPPPKYTVSSWADANRRLDSQSSAEAGAWSTSRAEYQRGIMDACSDPKIKEVVVMAGAQLGKSEALLNIIGYHIDHDPCPILMLQPTESMAQSSVGSRHETRRVDQRITEPEVQSHERNQAEDESRTWQTQLPLEVRGVE